ncbi:Cof family hydrolase subfamily protein [Toxoplasma gondii TgCatPRC2]|uniref:Cof family hydrolase subfamily protein n=3 Tax=Toxoplasma gondii TaxID=5811 RepID=A0A151HSD1_TOXGO|nr:Cof family hydrolase subfamily protein [Toxoplasma gondii ME49]EPT30510.1 Cof family hydrolase subfamily protein [Toxoplasma gondii ME49]KYF41006.1 Cof family hydrolase subfamily protein [Toxoplasma gondii ARI]KYK72071.1 Cof family hydrolase subfamily protein [Toxoplasma gondii TgCatPRC2]|eukprot:XP_002366880.1 Cof family hydrolase subfamily protein [Toxoplasma gondii ME49]
MCTLSSVCSGLPRQLNSAIRTLQRPRLVPPHSDRCGSLRNAVTPPQSCPALPFSLVAMASFCSSSCTSGPVGREKYFSRSCFGDRGIPIRAVVTDLDGTLLNSDHLVSRANVAACARLRQKGIACVFATGRPHVGTVHCIGPAVLEEMGMPNAFPGVYMNGCLVYGSDGKLLHAEYLDKELQKQVFSLLEERNLVNRVCGYQGEGLFCCEKNPYTWYTKDEYDECEPVVLPSVDDLKNMNLCKLTFNGSPQEVTEFRALLEGFVKNGNGRCVQPIPRNVEFIPKSVSKAKGLDILFASMNITKAEVVALGDSENDLEMLRHVDLSVCVANGCESAKEAAKFVTLSNDQDGFAAVVKEICDDLEDRETKATRGTA